MERAELIAAALDPPPESSDVGLGGRFRSRDGDFRVDEIPAYPADGRPGHLLLAMTKRGTNTEDALRAVARHLGVPRSEVGYAGRKDRRAITRQWISVPAPDPARTQARLDRFRHPAITLEPGEPHSHKLRRGHLRGNAFAIVVRGVDPEVALEPAREKLEHLRAVGMRNYYGAQRFGREGANLEPGLAALAGRGRRKGKGDIQLAAGQSALFNLYLAVRAERGLLDRALAGDVLEKRTTGGRFVCVEPTVDSERIAAGELVVTGPMFGGKMRWPEPGPALALEEEVLAAAGLNTGHLAKLGKRVPGTRRPLRAWPTDVSATASPATDHEREPDTDLDTGLDRIELRFALPAGSYATVLLRELGVPQRA